MSDALPAWLRALSSGQVHVAMSRLRSVDDALAWALHERVFWLVEGADFRGLEPAEQRTLHAQLRALRQRSALRSEAMTHDLRTLSEALHARGVTPVALKGAAIGARLYGEHALRPSIDIDLLIAAEDVDATHDVFEAHGWHAPSGVRGRWVSGQFTYRSPRSPALATSVDIHWRLTNRPALNHALRYEQLLASAVPRRDAFPFCATIAPAHALVHAIVHLVAHHGRSEIPALWWLDIAGLDATLTSAERRDALALLARAGLLDIAGEVWRDAVVAVGFTPSPETRHLLARPSTRRWRLRPSNRAQEVLADLSALHATQRLAYLRELAIPPEDSLRAAYGPSEANTPLWQLHLRRWLRRGVRAR